MNISSKSWLINGTANPYQQIRLQADFNSSIKKPQTTQNISAENNKFTPSISAHNILSVREKETLQALFKDPDNSFTFYGTNKAKNVHSGFLLDIKG